MTLQNKLANAVFLCLWIVVLFFGFAKLVMYANTAGEPARAPSGYPADTKLGRDANLPTLLMFGHPHCPCSKASIGELERLMPRLKDKVKTYVIFVKPATLTDDWAREDLWQRAAAIPGVHTVLDIGGVEARHFGAMTSGQTFLYDAGGNLVFRGGITPARGHMGDNLGRDSILSFLETGKTTITSTPVFGCSLKNPERAPAGERSL